MFIVWFYTFTLIGFIALAQLPTVVPWVNYVGMLISVAGMIWEASRYDRPRVNHR